MKKRYASDMGCTGKRDVSSKILHGLVEGVLLVSQLPGSTQFMTGTGTLVHETNMLLGQALIPSCFAVCRKGSATFLRQRIPMVVFTTKCSNVLGGWTDIR